MRVRTRWFNKGKPKSIEELASVVAFTSWRWTRRAIERMLAAGFEFPDDRRRFGILSEYVIFLAQATDRLVYGRIDDDERRRMVVAAVRRLGAMLDENMRERVGEGDHASEFIALFNRRADEYASISLGPDGPGYGMFRFLAEKIRDRVDAADQRWLYEQVMEVEAPEGLRVLRRTLDGLFAPREPGTKTSSGEETAS